jgi:hypothetical protein
MQRLLKMLVFANVLSRSCQRESNLGTTASARRKVLAPHACHFMSGGVICIVNHSINSRFWNFFAWLILDRHGLIFSEIPLAIIAKQLRNSFGRPERTVLKPTGKLDYAASRRAGISQFLRWLQRRPVAQSMGETPQ